MGSPRRAALWCRHWCRLSHCGLPGSALNGGLNRPDHVHDPCGLSGGQIEARVAAIPTGALARSFSQSSCSVGAGLAGAAVADPLTQPYPLPTPVQVAMPDARCGKTREAIGERFGTSAPPCSALLFATTMSAVWAQGWARPAVTRVAPRMREHRYA